MLVDFVQTQEVILKKLYIKQKVFSVGEKFTVMNENQEPYYYVRGSFLKIPKVFTIIDTTGEEIGKVTKKVFALLPKFYVEISGKEQIMIEKRLSVFRAKYDIHAEGLEIDGDWWDLNFGVYKNGQQVADINKKLIAWGDTYEVTILDESLEELIICLVVAIDCVKADEADSSTTSVID